MTLREKKRAATERRIRSAAQRLFIARGFQSTSMEDIAAEAEVSRATLFNYFPGKSALLEALAESLEARLVQFVAHYRHRESSADQALLSLFHRAAGVLEQTADLTRLLVLETGARRGFPRLLAEFVELAEVGRSSGRWREDVDGGQLAELLYLAFMAGLLGWCRRPQLTIGDEFAARARALDCLLTAGG